MKASEMTVEAEIINNKEVKNFVDSELRMRGLRKAHEWRGNAALAKAEKFTSAEHDAYAGRLHKVVKLEGDAFYAGVRSLVNDVILGRLCK